MGAGPRRAVGGAWGRRRNTAPRGARCERGHVGSVGTGTWTAAWESQTRGTLTRRGHGSGRHRHWGHGYRGPNVGTTDVGRRYRGRGGAQIQGTWTRGDRHRRHRHGGTRTGRTQSRRHRDADKERTWALKAGMLWDRGWECGVGGAGGRFGGTQTGDVGVRAQRGTQ